MATGAAMALLLCAVFALHTLTEAQQGSYDACRMDGGKCVLVQHCPPGKLSNTKGLCPWKGYECCRLPLESLSPCQGSLGICRLKCARSMWIEHNKECASGEICCLLIT